MTSRVIQTTSWLICKGSEELRPTDFSGGDRLDELVMILARIEATTAKDVSAKFEAFLSLSWIEDPLIPHYRLALWNGDCSMATAIHDTLFEQIEKEDEAENLGPDYTVPHLTASIKADFERLIRPRAIH